jgi:hypothetical protein
LRPEEKKIAKKPCFTVTMVNVTPLTAAAGLRINANGGAYQSSKAYGILKRLS